MGFTKIQEADILGKQVADLQDIPEMTAAELKAQFDKVSKEVVIPKFNQLSKELDEAEIDKAVKAGKKMYIRVNEDKQLEYSYDGENFETIGSSGHLIVSADGAELPTRGRLRFSGEFVTEDSPETNETVVKNPEVDYSEIEFDTEEIVVEDPQEPEREIVSDAYKTTGSYAVGDYCIYENELYRCISDTSGEFDATCWKKTLVASELKTLNANLGMDLLWENPSPTSEFSAQTISLDLSSYKYIILNVRLDYGDIESTNIICLKELPSRINSTRTTLSYRYVTVSDTGVEFSDARYTNTLGGSTTVDNKFAIPYRIYGIKS